jgi:flagellar hook-associated protein 1 FlgK
MGANILAIGVTGLNAAQVQLATTSHNISNASTPGYTRQQAVQQANEPTFTGGGFIGQGTNVETVQRIYNRFLTAQVLTVQTSASEMDSYLAQISQINNLVADPASGMTPAMSGFYSALSDLSATPNSIPARQAFLSAAESLTARFQSLDQRIGEIRSGVNRQIESQVVQINSYGQQIADINQQILTAQSAGTGQPANDLHDQRDQLIAELNKLIRVSAVPQTDGSYNIFIGSGQPLVIGNGPSKLLAQQDAYDPLRTTVALQLPTGTSFALPESQLTGGALGGLVAFRNTSLDVAQNALGRVAMAMAETFNTQHRLGQDLNGALGGDFFTLPAAEVMSHANNVLPIVNVGVTIADVGAVTTSDYQLTSNGAGNFTLLRLSDNTVLVNSAALPASVDGLAIVPAGPVVAGSSYLIRPTRSAAGGIDVAVGNTRDIALAAPIRTGAALANTGTGRISAGEVTSVASLPLAPAVTLTYDQTTNSFSGFPVGSTVTVSGDPGSPYVIALPTTPVTFTAGATVSFNGIRFTLDGAPNDNDSFTIAANTSGVSDNRNALLLGALQTAKPLDGGTTTFQGAYSSMVNQIGNKTREVQVNGEAMTSMVEQAQKARDSVSAVNLDEEAANLLRYQQAYQASAKLIAISGKLFDSLLEVSN